MRMKMVCDDRTLREVANEFLALKKAQKIREQTLNDYRKYINKFIEQQDVIDQKMGSRGTVRTNEFHYDFAGLSVSTGTKYSSDKFIGVDLLYSTTLFKGSDIHVSLAEFEIKGGNFAFYVIFDGEVVGQVTPGENAMAEFRLDNVEKTGTLEYVIAGESASFSFIAPKDFE